MIDIKNLTKTISVIVKTKKILAVRHLLIPQIKKKLTRIMLNAIHTVYDITINEFPENRINHPKIPRKSEFEAFDRNLYSDIFRFRSPEDLQRIKEGFGFPNNVKVHGYKFTGAAIIMISLVRLSRPLRWTDVMLR
jgi:hypothetical protein